MIWLAGAVLLLLALGALYQWWGWWRDMRRHPMPGRETAGLHFHATGSGPVVVLEAGISASSVSWGPVARMLADEFTVVAYDRAGYGWSAASNAPRTLDRLMEELHRGLEAGGFARPVILAGHSFGGLMARHYAARYPEDVAGLVLVDPLEPVEWCAPSAEQLARLGRGVRLARRGALLARFGVVRLGLAMLLAGSRRLPMLLARASSGKGSAVTGRLAGEIGKLPRELWPVVASHWSLARSFRTLAEYLERLPETCALPVDGTHLYHKPLTVISAATSAVAGEHGRTAAASQLGEHIVAENAGHWIQLDQPDIIKEAVRRVARLTIPDIQ